jgi:hypothetical protein
VLCVQTVLSTLLSALLGLVKPSTFTKARNTRTSMSLIIQDPPSEDASKAVFYMCTAYRFTSNLSLHPYQILFSAVGTTIKVKQSHNTPMKA